MELANNPQLIHILVAGKVAVIPTDTIYGLVGKADNRSTIERIYQIKKRNPDKPTIILLANLEQLKYFGVELTAEQEKLLDTVWPGSVSVILPCPHQWLSYLHRETNTLAFRLVASEDLRKLLEQTGPLIAPSANPENLPPASSIAEAKTYFGSDVDYYPETETTLTNHQPSTLVAIVGNKFIIKRQGASIIPNELLS